MKITPEMFGLTQAEVNEFDKQQERLQRFLQEAKAASRPEHTCDRSGWMPGDGCPACAKKESEK